MRNVELKVRCPDLAAVRARAEALGAEAVAVLEQRDTFFAATDGRLKLREVVGGTAELIAYRRPDGATARGSDYERCAAPEPAVLATVLAHALGTAGVVEKRRHLYRWRRTRIHLDDVRGLGTFVELETVLDGQGEDDAHAELAEVAAALELRDVVPVAYVDLVREA